MADYSGMITQGFGMLAAEKDKQRQVHPAIEQMIRSMGPKRAAIAMQLGLVEGGNFSTPPSEPTKTVNVGVPAESPQVSPQSLASYAAAPQPAQNLSRPELNMPQEESLGGPMTTRDLEDYQKAAPFINAARERPYRDYLGEIEARGNQARQTEGVKTEGRKTIEATKQEGAGGRQEKDLEEKRAARGQKHGEFMYKMKQDWESLKMKLSEAKDRLRIDHGDEIAKELLKQAGANLRSAETNVKGYRTSLPELAGDPGMDEEANRVEQEIPRLRKEFEDTVDMLKGRKSQSGSVTRTSGGASVSGPQGSTAVQDAAAKRARAKQLIFGQ